MFLQARGQRLVICSVAAACSISGPVTSTEGSIVSGLHYAICYILDSDWPLSWDGSRQETCLVREGTLCCLVLLLRWRQ